MKIELKVFLVLEDEINLLYKSKYLNIVFHLNFKWNMILQKRKLNSKILKSA
jgi:hypothetical protein